MDKLKAMDVTNAEPGKELWTTPKIQIVELSQAQGAQAGPLCDKHGSLSSSTNSGLQGNC